MMVRCVRLVDSGQTKKQRMTDIERLNNLSSDAETCNGSESPLPAALLRSAGNTVMDAQPLDRMNAGGRACC